MKYTMTLAAAAVALAAVAGGAQAGCAYSGKALANSFHAIPGFMMPQLNPTAHTSPNLGSAAQDIVGTWLVTYTSEGAPFGQALIQWHSDYTEWENINLPPAGGVCVGSWKPVDDSHVTRLHYGWLFANGALSGYFTETETNKVKGHNAYSGVNDTKIFDVNGNLLAEVNGTSNAVRIAP